MKRSALKSKGPSMTPLRASAEGEACTLNILGVCNYDPSTVVLCHLPFVAKERDSRKAPDYCAAYGCSACHDALDGRTMVLSKADKLFYGCRGLIRTLRRMVEKGLITVKGIQPGGVA